MEKLIRLVERRKELGKRPSYKKDGNYNDIVEYNRIGCLILEEITRLYDEGKLESLRRYVEIHEVFEKIVKTAEEDVTRLNGWEDEFHLGEKIAFEHAIDIVKKAEDEYKKIPSVKELYVRHLQTT